MSMQPSGAKRAPGRPRSEEADSAILVATLRLLAEGGFHALSMEAVATSAGVGKATLYRRYSGKTELVVAALGMLPPPEPPPDTGSLAGDFDAMAQTVRTRLRATGLGSLIARVAAEGLSNPDLQAVARANVIDPLRGRLAELVRRGIDRGELRAGLDVERVVDVMHGTLIYRLLLAGGNLDEIEDVPEEVVKLLIAGIGKPK